MGTKKKSPPDVRGVPTPDECLRVALGRVWVLFPVRKRWNPTAFRWSPESTPLKWLDQRRSK